MISPRILRRALSTSMLVALLAAPAAQAYSDTVSAPVTRNGRVVGRATALLVTTDTGWAIAQAKVTGFVAPSANQRWRVRTTLRSGCAVPRTGEGLADGEQFEQYEALTFSSRWRLTRIAATTGALTTNDVVRECPTGKQPAGSIVVSLAVQDQAGAATVGRAQLFAAG